MRVSVWIITFMLVITAACKLLSYPNTVANIAGFLVVITALAVSINTKCLISIKSKSKNESKI